jgi:hypothetical protein
MGFSGLETPIRIAGKCWKRMATRPALPISVSVREAEMSNITINENSGAATGGVRDLLRWEGVALFIGMTLFYWISGASWLHYALGFFVPDLALLAYLAGPRIGAGVYNATHATIGPLLLVLFGLLTAEPLPGAFAMIWLAHIGFDRTLGYGLKYETGFRFTHLGRIGKDAAAVKTAATNPTTDNQIKAA